MVSLSCARGQGAGSQAQLAYQHAETLLERVGVELVALQGMLERVDALLVLLALRQRLQASWENVEIGCNVR